MRIIVLFNLKPDADPLAYESWVASTDIPTVRALPSIAGFRVHALTGLLFGPGTPPYAYCEILDVADMDQFGRDVSTEAMKSIAAQFKAFTDAPLFLTTREVGA